MPRQPVPAGVGSGVPDERGGDLPAVCGGEAREAEQAGLGRSPVRQASTWHINPLRSTVEIE